MESTDYKIKPLRELPQVLEPLRNSGKKIVHCHGVFDLLHIGHIKHLEAARRLGDVLVVTLTPDQFVNKGPHRPAFPERLRAEALASLACVDFVSINESRTAVEPIQLVRPALYVKGIVRESGKRDHTDAIVEEERAVQAVGGKLAYTDEDTYSASTLINRFMDIFTPQTKAFLEEFRTRYTPEQIVGHLQALKDLKVLVIGETIIDEYQFCTVMGKSSKEPVLAALHNYTEKYPGGALAIANHIANFCGKVGLLSCIGEVDSHEELILSQLNPGIVPYLVRIPNARTIIKRRFLEEYLAAKLFEVYVMQGHKIEGEVEAGLVAKLESCLSEYDVVIVADYGHGLMTEPVIRCLTDKAKFLAVNTQSNAGNRGFNTISKYPRADFISLGEPEVRLDCRRLDADLEELASEIARRSSCQSLLVTRGSSGCLCYDRDKGPVYVPAFSIRVVDRVGSGDAVLALTAPCVAMGVPPEIVGFVANVVGAEACMIMGNRSSIEGPSLFRHITSLMK